MSVGVNEAGQDASTARVDYVISAFDRLRNLTCPAYSNNASIPHHHRTIVRPQTQPKDPTIHYRDVPSSPTILPALRRVALSA
jgi:hypothetical protein